MMWLKLYNVEEYSVLKCGNQPVSPEQVFFVLRWFSVDLQNIDFPTALSRLSLLLYLILL